MWSVITSVQIARTYQLSTLLPWPLNCCLILVSQLHTAHVLSLQPSSATFSSTACTVYCLATTMLHSFWASAVPLPAPAARGNVPAPRDWNAAVCVWVDGRQSVACLHFIYHSLGAVNLHRCLSISISLLVGLHLLFSLFLSSCPTVCVSQNKSLCDTL